MPEKTVAVIIPYYNEPNTIVELLNKIPNVYYKIIVDDGSTMMFPRLVIRENRFQRTCIVRCPINMGKGYAIRYGASLMKCDIILIQDADLELSPEDYPALLEPILSGKADVVLGSRFLNTNSRKILGTWHYLFTKALTMFSNMCSGIYLTDMPCGYKVFKKEVLDRITLEENRFGFDPEIVAKVAKLKIPVWEVAVSYNRRTKAEGKKIRYRDGLVHLWCIVKYNLLRTK